MSDATRRQPPPIWTPSAEGPDFEDVRLSRSVAGRVVLVTGAASGMGRATARVFADEGARVVVTDRRLEDAERVATHIRTGGGDARAFALDVGDAAAIQAGVAAIARPSAASMW